MLALVVFVGINDLSPADTFRCPSVEERVLEYQDAVGLAIGTEIEKAIDGCCAHAELDGAIVDGRNEGMAERQEPIFGNPTHERCASRILKVSFAAVEDAEHPLGLADNVWRGGHQLIEPVFLIGDIISTAHLLLAQHPLCETVGIRLVGIPVGIDHKQVLVLM